VHIAPSRQKLENILTSVGGIASAANCELIRLDYQQEQGYSRSKQEPVQMGTD